MQDVLRQYKALLETIDTWFKGAQLQFSQEMQCGHGCSGCCRGVFDVTLLDASLVSYGYQQLTPEQRDTIKNQASERLRELHQRWPGFESPYILNGMPDSEWTVMPEDDETPCPFLDDRGLCLVYAYRPMTCRLHGLPNIDDSGESFSDDFCSLNFQSIDPLSLPQLKWGFRQAFQQENELFHLFSKQLTGKTFIELDTLLQLVPLIDFERTDWHNLNVYSRPGKALKS